MIIKNNLEHFICLNFLNLFVFLLGSYLDALVMLLETAS